MRAYWRTSESSLFGRLEHARVHNAHALYRMIDGLCPLPGKSFSSLPPVTDGASSAEREAEAQRFLASFEAILCGHKASQMLSHLSYGISFSHAEMKAIVLLLVPRGRRL